MEGIIFSKDELLSVSSRNDIFGIQYYKTKSYLQSIENFVNFVKACEKVVRTSSEYKAYIAQLFSLGLTKCQVLGHVEVSDDKDETVTLEMHHGPILTLFDYCAIVTDHLLFNNKNINTFLVARIVLNEHFNGNIQTIMLSKTVHQLVDSGKLFISFNQAIGNLNEFLRKYKDGLNPERISKINRYIELSKEYDTYDNHLLDLKNTITDWNYEVAKKRMEK